ncbi:MAG: Panacea domain-containing protein [Fervidobacterium sp.]|uniref:Panacea domain-containing protein n=1 Tax=Fervidobacterium TaxID=2422 RepID=UPI0030ABB307
MLSKQEEIVICVLKNIKNVPKTKLLKLLYLIDREAVRVFKRTLTGFRYYRYLYGPYTIQIEDVINSLSLGQYITFDYRITSSQREVYLLVPEKKAREYKLKTISKEEMDLIDDILERYGSKRLDSILKEVYGFEEIKNAEFAEEIKLGGN